MVVSVEDLQKQVSENTEMIRKLNEFKNVTTFWLKVGTAVAAAFGIGSIWSVNTKINSLLDSAAANKIISDATEKVVENATPTVVAAVKGGHFTGIGGSDNVTPFDSDANRTDLPLELTETVTYKFETKNIPKNATELLVMAQSGLDSSWGNFLRVYKIWSQESGKEFSYRFVVRSNDKTNNQLEEQYFWIPITSNREVYAKVMSDIAQGTPNTGSGSMSLWIAGWR